MGDPSRLQISINPWSFVDRMATPNRSAIITKLQKVLRKHYKPVAPVERPVLEQLLFACLLENAHHEPAEEALAAVMDSFYDLNEVRVSTTGELAQVFPRLNNAETAARRLRQVLQNVFESSYTFDLESLRKMKLGQATQYLEKKAKASPFAVAYITQISLGGHAIPMDSGTLDAMEVLDLVESKGPKKARNVPGIIRAIPKTKGVEVSSLLHQLGADFHKSPYSPAVHKILLEISPEAKPNLPKRVRKKAAVEEPEPKAKTKKAKAASEKSTTKKKAAKAAKSKTKASVATKKPAAKKKAAKKKAAPRRIAKRKPR